MLVSVSFPSKQLTFVSGSMLGKGCTKTTTCTGSVRCELLATLQILKNLQAGKHVKLVVNLLKTRTKLLP